MSEPNLEVNAVFREDSKLVRAGASPLTQLLLGTAPWTGGIASLLSAEANSRQEERLRLFLQELVAEVDALAARDQNLDRAFVGSDEFLAMTISMLQEAARTTDADRLKYLRSFLSGASRTVRPDVSWLELFQRYVVSLTGAHIVLLDQIYFLQRGIPASDRLGRIRMRGVPVNLDSLSVKGYSLLLRRLCLTDVANLGLLADWKLLSGEGPSQQEYSLTRNGLMFMRFLNLEWGLPPDREPVD